MKKKASALVEFALTTAVLSIWAVACVAAFQATRSESGSSDNAPLPRAVVASPAQASASAPMLMEAALTLQTADTAGTARPL